MLNLPRTWKVGAVWAGAGRGQPTCLLSRQLLAAGQPVPALDCCWQLGWAGQPMSGARLRTQICDNSSSIHLKSKSRPDCLFIISLELRFSLQRSAFQRHHSTFLTTEMNGIRMFIYVLCSFQIDSLKRLHHNEITFI